MSRNTDAGARSRLKVAPPPPAFPGHDDIARRAYELWVKRGMSDGLDGDDWLQAERELLDRAAKKATAPPRPRRPH